MEVTLFDRNLAESRGGLVETQVVRTMIGDIATDIEVVCLGGEEEVAFKALDFAGVVGSVEAIAKTLSQIARGVRPSRTEVEFGVAIGLESGALTALLVGGTANANLKVTIVWEDDKIAPGE